MDELDAVSVCTPNNFHAGPTIAALNAGKHVLCEKPIAGNAVDGQAMVDAQKASGKVLQPKHITLRCNPDSVPNPARCANSTTKASSATFTTPAPWRCGDAVSRHRHRS